MHTFSLFHSMHWYACHACLCHTLAFDASLYTCSHVYAWVCLLVCHPYFNTMKIWTPNPNLHLSPVDTTFCWLFCYACHIYLACLLCTLCILSTHLFISNACLLVSCSCLCMYTLGARMHRAKVRSPRCKQKGQGCEHMDISQVAMFSRFRGLASPIWLCTFF